MDSIRRQEPIDHIKLNKKEEDEDERRNCSNKRKFSKRN